MKVLHLSAVGRFKNKLERYKLKVFLYHIKTDITASPFEVPMRECLLLSFR